MESVYRSNVFSVGDRQLVQLKTKRLLLRPPTMDDAPSIQQLVSAHEIALNTLLIPHPYPEGGAAEWLSRQGKNPNDHTFAITLRKRRDLIGAIGLEVKPEHDRGEIGYWIGVPYWGLGYMTEAARAVVGWAFEELALNRIFAQHFTRNPASGRVLQKIGMRHEGTLRQHNKKWDEYLDVEVYGIVRSEWPARVQ